MSEHPSLATRCAIPDAVIFRELDGEAVVLNLDTGIYFGLDPVGTRIWQLIAECGLLTEVHARMMAEFEVVADRLECDLLAFVGELRSRGLVTLEG